MIWLYTDPNDGRRVYLMVTPFGCLITKNPNFHRILIYCLIGAFMIGMIGLGVVGYFTAVSKAVLV